jgi:hypothetical protein
MSDSLQGVERIAIDADVLMNLVASGRLAAIVEALRIRPVVAPAVASEALYLFGEEAGDAPEPIDIVGLMAAGTLERAAMTEGETELYVELAAEVDDGEAQAIALALGRGTKVASDDRRACRAAVKRGIVVVTTPELMERWARLLPADQGIADCLQRIERRAHYRPAANHPLCRWWQAQVQTEVTAHLSQ